MSTLNKNFQSTSSKLINGTFRIDFKIIFFLTMNENIDDVNINFTNHFKIDIQSKQTP